ncbi:MAG: site-specific DNA-methyltransferase [Rickettsiales bacterium]|jgi:modification methylase|nr:site-specific DNA-methyltransferase [Rickettsiales bacterium]
MIEKNKILCGDCLTFMRQMPSEFVDLIITSPPYNIKNSTGNGMKCGNGGKWSRAALIDGYQNYDDNMPYDKYIKWQRDCLTEMMRLIPENGAVFYNHKWRVQSGLLQDRREIIDGFPVRQIIIWKRKGGINFNPGYFLPTYEVIYLIAKPKFVLTQKANAFGDVWEFTQELNNSHPAPFPVNLIDRIISATTANLILDPFMGSGTTAIAAIRNNRDYIGFDISKKYVDMANERVRQEHNNPRFVFG